MFYFFSFYTLMHIVYPLIKTQDDNIELRYSLRSIKNIKHDGVFIVGYYPKRIQNVEHISMGDGLEKGKNVYWKMVAVCKDERISEDFIRMMDDIFVLDEIKKIEYHKLGTIKEHIKHIEKTYTGLEHNNYYKAIKEAGEIFPNGNDYSVHCPIVFNKKKLLRILEKYEGMYIDKRTAYCNEYKIEGVQLEVPEYKHIPNEKLKDCKCYDIEKLGTIKNQLYISSDNKIVGDKFIEFIHNRFPQPSQYESLSYFYRKMEKVKVLFLKALYPYNKGDVGELKGAVAEKRLNKGYVELLVEEKAEKKVEKKVEKKEIKKPVANKSMAKRAKKTK